MQRPSSVLDVLAALGLGTVTAVGLTACSVGNPAPTPFDAGPDSGASVRDAGSSDGGSTPQDGGTTPQDGGAIPQDGGEADAGTTP